MPTKQLYNVRIPQDAQTDAGLQGLGHELESLSGPGTDEAIVEALGVQSGEHTISASFAHKHAAKVAAELEELLQAGGYDYIPYYNPETGEGKYIGVEDGSVQTASVHEDRVQVVEASFTPKGTLGSHRRRIRVRPQTVHRNDFGNDTSALVAIPSAAEKRTWYNRETQSREPVSIVETVSGELGDVDLLDARAVDFANPYELVYKVPYDEEYRVGVVLWDTRGHASRDDLEGDVQWWKAYQASHEYSGVPVVDTGRLRLYLDEQAGLSAETYDSSQDTWNQVGLPDSEWSLRDVDITTVSPLRVEAQLEFSHPEEGLFALNAVAGRGRDSVQLLVPESVEAATPQGLRDRLDEVAAPEAVRAHGSLGLITREEVRR